MTQEELDLLTKDLGSRLFYRPICNISDQSNSSADIKQAAVLIGIDEDFAHCYPLSKYADYDSSDDKSEDYSYLTYIESVKPYLRPMESMTKEEENEYQNCGFDDIAESVDILVPTHTIDFLNAHHFDYQGLIEKGLAFEAPSDMYKLE